MTLSEWINNIRWKYFTNQKAGLIFKETTKEFRIVHKMTENKRYYRTNVNLEDNNHEPYYNIRDRKKEGNNVLFMVGGKYTSKEIVDRLNEQDERIKGLETVIQQILYETRANHTKGEYSAIVSVSPQMHDKLTDLLTEKMW